MACGRQPATRTTTATTTTTDDKDERRRPTTRTSDDDRRPTTRTSDKYFRESQGSLHETVGALDAARVLGVVSEADAKAVQQLGFRLRGMLHGLMR